MRAFILLIGFVLLLCGSAAAQDEVRVVELRHRDAADLLPPLREMLGDGVRASAFEGKLLLRGSGEALASAEDLVRALDVPRPVLRVSVHQDASRTGIVRRLGTAAGGPGPQSERRLSTSERRAQQSLQVLDGEKALIVVGREVPFTHDILAVAGRHVAVQREVVYREATTGFVVRPRLQGEEVLVEVTPHMTLFSGDREDALDFHRLATTVRIPLGEWYNLAAHLESGDEVSRSILTLRAGGGETDRSLWIRVER